MALSRGRRYEPVNYWPGFVDALSTMLLVIIFLLSVFMLAQFFLSREVTGKDAVLARLNRQIEELTNLLALERTQKGADESKIAMLSATLDAADKETQRLKDAAAQGAVAADAAGRAAAATSALDQQKDISARALAEVDVLNQQIAALRRQLAAIEDALSASEAANKESQSKIADLGSRLNVALAQKVQELNRYRSDFFGRLRQILGRARTFMWSATGSCSSPRFSSTSARPRSARTANSRSIVWQPRSSISSVKSRRTSPGSCASTAIPIVRR